MSTLTVSIVTNAKEETAAFTKGIFPDQINVLLQTESEMVDSIEKVDVLIPGHINVGQGLIERGKKLKLIHCGTGYNNIDLDAASKIGAYVAVTPNVAATSVAELVFAAMAALCKKITTFDASMKSGGWKSTDFIGVPQLKGKTLGIIGFGNIGKEAARIGRGFGMKLMAHDPHIEINSPDVQAASLEQLLRASDFITLHVLLTPQTKGMIGTEQLNMMKETAILANACRGPVVNEQALIEALKQRKIRGACLDVYEKEPLAPDSELRELDNVILTPHIAYCADEALAGRFHFFADNCRRLMSGEVPMMVVNGDRIKNGS